jgi:hypothetical protein
MARIMPARRLRVVVRPDTGPGTSRNRLICRFLVEDLRPFLDENRLKQHLAGVLGMNQDRGNPSSVVVAVNADMAVRSDSIALVLSVRASRTSFILTQICVLQTQDG